MPSQDYRALPYSLLCWVNRCKTPHTIGRNCHGLSVFTWVLAEMPPDLVIFPTSSRLVSTHAARVCDLIATPSLTCLPAFGAIPRADLDGWVEAPQMGSGAESFLCLSAGGNGLGVRNARARPLDVLLWRESRQAVPLSSCVRLRRRNSVDSTPDSN